MQARFTGLPALAGLRRVLMASWQPLCGKCPLQSLVSLQAIFPIFPWRKVANSPIPTCGGGRSGISLDLAPPEVDQVSQSKPVLAVGRFCWMLPSKLSSSRHSISQKARMSPAHSGSLADAWALAGQRNLRRRAITLFCRLSVACPDALRCDGLQPDV